MIYFIQAGENGPIKIGYTVNIRKRFEAIKVSMHNTATLLGITEGELAKERCLHRQFASTRIKGEWFQNSPELLEFIAENATTLELSSVSPFDYKPKTSYTIEEVAKLVGIDKSTILEIVKSGMIAGIKPSPWITLETPLSTDAISQLQIHFLAQHCPQREVLPESPLPLEELFKDTLPLDMQDISARFFEASAMCVDLISSIAYNEKLIEAINQDELAAAAHTLWKTFVKLEYLASRQES